MSELPYWERLSLHEMDRQQWEGLCDGCGKCCLLKLEDEDTEELHYTRVVCRYREQGECRCTVYTKRKKLVPACWVLQPDDLAKLNWMPSSCAYRLLHEGKALPIWHPLIAGNRQAMIDSGNCISCKVISEEYVHEAGLQEHIVHWVS